MVYMYHIFFIHSSAYEHLGYLDIVNLLDIVNNAAMNISVHVSFQISFFKYLPRIGFVGSYGSSVFSVLRNLYTIILWITSFLFHFLLYSQCYINLIVHLCL